MLPARRLPRRPGEWGGSRAIFIAVVFWIVGALLFATRLSLLKHAPIHSAPAPNIAVDAPSYSQSNRRRLDTSHKNTTTTAPLPPQLPTFSPPPFKFDQRVSNFGASLSPDSLKGGWMFTEKVYNHATQNLQKNNAAIISWDSPRVVLFRNFLALKEVDDLIKLAESGFKRSEVVSDSQVVSQSRTSYGAWLNGERRTNSVYQIQNRIAQVTGIPESFGESLYVLRYKQGQKYEMHTDHCRQQQEEKTLTESCRTFLQRAGGPKCGLQGGGETCGDRLATFIIYLKTPEEGGETVFPRAKIVEKNNNLRNQSMAATAAEKVAKKEGEGISSNNSDSGGNSQARLRSLIDKGADGTLGQAENGFQSHQIEKENVDSPAALRISSDPGHLSLTSTTSNNNNTNDNKGDENMLQLPWYCRKESEGQVLKVRPQPGDAIFFFNYFPNEAIHSWAIPDPTSAHSGCPPTKGTKMIATRWMRSSVFG